MQETGRYPGRVYRPNDGGVVPHRRSTLHLLSKRLIWAEWGLEVTEQVTVTRQKFFRFCSANLFYGWVKESANLIIQRRTITVSTEKFSILQKHHSELKSELSETKSSCLHEMEKSIIPHLCHCCYLSHKEESIREEGKKCWRFDFATCLYSKCSFFEMRAHSHSSLWSPSLRRHLLQTDLFVVSWWVLTPGAWQHSSLLCTQVIRWVISLR